MNINNGEIHVIFMIYNEARYNDVQLQVQVQGRTVQCRGVYSMGFNGFSLRVIYKH
jgi:hypothetical protein